MRARPISSPQWHHYEATQPKGHPFKTRLGAILWDCFELVCLGAFMALILCFA